MAQQLDLSKLTGEEKDAVIYALLERVAELERRKCQNSGHTMSQAVYSLPRSTLFYPLGGHHRIQRSELLQEEPSFFGKRDGLVHPAPNSESLTHFLKGLTKL